MKISPFVAVKILFFPVLNKLLLKNDCSDTKKKFVKFLITTKNATGLIIKAAKKRESCKKCCPNDKIHNMKGHENKSNKEIKISHKKSATKN